MAGVTLSRGEASVWQPGSLYLCCEVGFYFGGRTLFSLMDLFVEVASDMTKGSLSSSKSLFKGTGEEPCGICNSITKSVPLGTETVSRCVGRTFPSSVNEQLQVHKVCQVYLANVNLSRGCSACLLMRPSVFLHLVDRPPPPRATDAHPPSRVD